MNRAALALRSILGMAVGAVWPEGAFLLFGTCALAVASTYVSPAGPWAVVGTIAILVALGLTFTSSGKG